MNLPLLRRRRAMTRPASLSEAPPPEPGRSDIERLDAAASILWNVEPTDRALTGWRGWGFLTGTSCWTVTS